MNADLHEAFLATLPEAEQLRRKQIGEKRSAAAKARWQRERRARYFLDPKGRMRFSDRTGKRWRVFPLSTEQSKHV